MSLMRSYDFKNKFHILNLHPDDFIKYLIQTNSLKSNLVSKIYNYELNIVNTQISVKIY